MKTRIATLGAVLFTVLAIGSTGLRAAAVEADKYLTVTGMEVYDVTDGQERLLESADLSDSAGAASAAEAAEGDPKPGDIINIGMKIWEIVDKNRPVINQNYSAISAVPYGVKSWDELEGWSMPVLEKHRVVYTNVYKMKVVEFEYYVAFTPNGSYQGKGKYLSRVEIEPKTIKVLWGYRFNADGTILNVTNVGTKDAPMAAMELHLNWSVSSVIKAEAQTVRYYIRGDGLLKTLTDGNIAPKQKEKRSFKLFSKLF